MELTQEFLSTVAEEKEQAREERYAEILERASASGSKACPLGGESLGYPAHKHPRTYCYYTHSRSRTDCFYTCEGYPVEGLGYGCGFR